MLMDPATGGPSVGMKVTAAATARGDEDADDSDHNEEELLTDPWAGLYHTAEYRERQRLIAAERGGHWVIVDAGWKGKAPKGPRSKKPKKMVGAVGGRKVLSKKRR